MAAAAFQRVELLVSDYQVLLVSDAQDVLRSMAPGSTAVTELVGCPRSRIEPGVA